MTQLSPHFTLAEMTWSMTALRKGWPNQPRPVHIKALGHVATHILEPVRAAFKQPFSPSSGYRSPRLNRYLGGSLYSQHCQGQAVDFRVPGVAAHEVAGWISQHLVFDQLILEYPEKKQGWIHCSYVPGQNRQQILQFDGQTYRPWAPENVQMGNAQAGE
ncbi:MAG: peptidase M15A [Kordiimonas sp.]|nr:peptidase M15A [Kordiimonas sp.]